MCVCMLNMLLFTSCVCILLLYASKASPVTPMLPSRRTVGAEEFEWRI